MEVKKHRAGQTGGQEVWEVCLKADSGMQVCLISYGAAIRQILLPGRDGRTVNVVLGFENWEDYIGNPLFAGAVLCPCAGRISGPSLYLDGRSLPLSDNDNGSNLHGGPGCASHRVWTLDATAAGRDFCSASFSVRLPDGLDGFPGNRIVKICYTLRVRGNRYIANDSRHIPVAVKLCLGTPFDFSRPVSLAGQISAWPLDPQLNNALGYNNAFLLEELGPGREAAPDLETEAFGRQNAGLREALTMRDSASGRSLTLLTDAPWVVVYSGGYIGDHYRLAGGAVSSPSCPGLVSAQVSGAK